MKRVLMALMAPVMAVGILTGCARDSDNTYAGIEEKKTVAETEHKEKETTEKQTDGYSIDKALIEMFVSDEHFYDVDEGLDFAVGWDESADLKEIKDERYHVRIVRAYTSDNVADFGEFALTDRVAGYLEGARTFIKDRKGYKDSQFTYMCIQLEVTNNFGEDRTLSMGSHFMYVSRIEDKRGEAFGLPNRRFELPKTYTEFWSDNILKANLGEGYFLEIPAGETVTVTCVYFVSLEELERDLYLMLHQDKGKYNAKYGCEFPPNDDTTKFLKINIEGR